MRGVGFVLVHLYSPGRHLSMPLTDVQVASLCDKEIPQDTFKVHPFCERGACIHEETAEVPLCFRSSLLGTHNTKILAMNGVKNWVD